MREHLVALAELHRIGDTDARRAAWRQGVAALASCIAGDTPAPLEGIPSESLRASVRVALGTGLVDDLSFLSTEHGAAALYELGAAMPAGDEKREIGRRVLVRMHECDASTFATLATGLAVASPRALRQPSLRARIAVTIDLPLDLPGRADALAFALAASPELSRDWLVGPATRTLAERRLAARLFERAAAEAARRAASGDDGAAMLLLEEPLAGAWRRLLGDRETLVWRHAAIGRGILAEALPSLAYEIEQDLDPQRTPTEWRRAAVSLAAQLGGSPAKIEKRIVGILGSQLVKQDVGVAVAMIHALPRSALSEPQIAESLLSAIVDRCGIAATEALTDARAEAGPSLGGAAARALAKAIEATGATGNTDARGALLVACLNELHDEGSTIRARLRLAMANFAEESPRAAWRHATALLGAIKYGVSALDEKKPDGTADPAAIALVLRDIDRALLEAGTLAALLRFGTKGEIERTSAALAGVVGSLGDWLLARVTDTTRVDVDPDLRQRELRALLHLVDAGGYADEQRTPEQREWLFRATRVLLERTRLDEATPLRRMTCAALARAVDGLLSEEACEISDAVLACADHVTSESLDVLSEASMVPTVEAAFTAWSKLARAAESTDIVNAPASARANLLASLRAAGRAIPPANGPRSDALRHSVMRLAVTLDRITAAHSIAALEPAKDSSPFVSLAYALDGIARLVAGARRRFGSPVPTPEGAPTIERTIRQIALALSRATDATRSEVAVLLEEAGRALAASLPRAMAAPVAVALVRILTLPLEGSMQGQRESDVGSAPRPLPAWLPPSRAVGGFYVVRALGSGAGGSVFVVRRVEDRHNPRAPSFALKVPEYDGRAARTLSEAEFLQMFREEAGALLTMPQHPRLARFVTFDAGAQPKPALVMELVEGPSLTDIIEKRDLTTATALRLLDGIAEGLATMHAVGIAHLDVKPSNVIVRQGKAGTAGDPVLVDFGLAGRKIRPGCATANFGAPEVWGLVPEGYDGGPTPADVYAFACVAFETLTGRTLFDAPAEVALVASHLAHDGRPERLDALAKSKGGAAFADALAPALRRDPRQRTNVAALRTSLKDLGRQAAGLKWPLQLA